MTTPSVLGSSNTWGSAAKCVLSKWTTEKACHGIYLPWALDSISYPNGLTESNGRWFRWLADEVSDRTAQFSVEQGDTIYMVVYEKQGRAPVNNDGVNVVRRYDPASPNYGYTSTTRPSEGYKCQPETHNWGIASFVVTGTTQSLILAAEILSLSLAF